MPPKTPAERQKKYRDKLKKEDPQKHEEKRLKHLEKIKENIRKRKLSLTESEKQNQLIKWRKQNADRAKKRKEVKEAKRSLKIGSTSVSRTENTSEKNITKKTTLQLLIEENTELKRKNSNLKRQNYRYKHEIINLKQILSESCSTESAIVTEIGNETPITKTNKFLEATIPTASVEGKEKVKKKLVLLNTLTESIKIQYETADTKEKKNVLKNLATHEMVNKYKQKTNITNILGLKGRIRSVTRRNTLRQKYSQELKAFFKRDDVSRPSAGKNECKTQNKCKMQKRYLTEPLYKLHKKYRAEGGRASLQTFCRFRPFYVVHPKIQDRNTCACVKHSNMLFKTTALKRLGVLQSSDLGDILGEVTCSPSFKCFYSECMDCKDKIPNLDPTIDTNCPTQWLQWKIITHSYTKVTKEKCEEKQTKKYAKVTVSGTVGTLVKEFLEDLLKFKTHQYNVNHQYQSWKQCINNLEDDEIVLICDFSENFACKQAEEIQAVHFGASRNQITLHTSVLYRKNEKPLSICSISPINEHGPGAIWAHLDPILQNCTKELKVKKVHIFSDSPATQYRQKNNFYMFQKRFSDYGFKFGTWNFFEASHGKGPADGVGGAIKRQLDNQIAHGHDITNAQEAYDYLKDNTKVKIFYISENQVEEMTKMIPNNVVPIKGTMKVHQIATNGDGSIKYKWLSCFSCEKNTFCNCYNTKEHLLFTTNTSSTKVLNNNNESHEIESKSNRKDNNKKIHKGHKRLSRKTIEVPAKKRKRSNSSTSTSTSVSDDAMSIYTDSDCLDLIEEEDGGEVNSDNEYEKTNKENKIGKVTVLSSIRLTPENRTYINLQTYDPLKLHHIDKKFYLSTSHNTKHKRIIEKENTLTKKINTLKSCNNNTLCNYSDLIKDINDNEGTYLKTAMKEKPEKGNKNKDDRETEDIKDNEGTYLKTAIKEKPEKSNKNKDDRETEDVKDNEGTYLKTAIKKKPEKSNKNKDDSETEDVKDNEGTYLKTAIKEKPEKSNKHKDDRETEDVKDMEGIYLKTAMKGKNMNKHDEQIKELEENVLEPTVNEQMMENDVNVETEDNQENKIFKLGDTVLARYYKKAWKYYVGVITKIHYNEKKYSISYYKSIGKKANVKFQVPKIEDLDCIPEINIVKKIELIQKSDSLSLMNEEDDVYF